MRWLRRESKTESSAARWLCVPSGHRVEFGPTLLRTVYLHELPAYLALVDDEIVGRMGWPSDWTHSYTPLLNALASDPDLIAPYGTDEYLENFAVFRESDDAMVGAISLSSVDGESDDVAELGFWIGSAFRGLGLASAAAEAMTRFGFTHLGLSRVVAATADDNAASQRVLARAGFIFTGPVKRTLPNGLVVDARSYERVPTDTTKVQLCPRRPGSSKSPRKRR